jgi:hypothetical protein
MKKMDQVFRMEAAQVMEQFNVGRDGLSDAQAAQQRQTYGVNALAEEKKKGVVQVFLEQFKDLLVIILMLTAVISAVTGNLESTLVILAVIILNAILGTWQHFKAEKSLESLKAMSAPNAKVMRNGMKMEIPARDIVPGDILLLEEKESAMEGAFTTTIGSDRALCFFGPGYADTLTVMLDISKIRRLGWAPTVSLRDMFARMIAWQKEQGRDS